MKLDQLPEKQRSALQTYVKLMRATYRATGDIHRHLQQDNLTHSQFAVLEALYHAGHLSQGKLGQKILKSNANLTTVVDSLEKKRLVQRQRTEEDRRRVVVKLTRSCEELIGKVFPRHAQIVEREFSLLTWAEQQLLGGLLKKLGKG
ncbi:MarR family winged helix-turn-helix transcriptional regulator [Malonomonas rubra]|uniref:MarR family winged helix-turn-helix transcriptional regulator n=1 Tax=Malonomonas rubra TaxID=57040 RepID=UPI0026EC410D|nr:MarR family transcriptional regulator [Malonomonas rubra]